MTGKDRMMLKVCDRKKDHELPCKRRAEGRERITSRNWAGKQGKHFEHGESVFDTFLLLFFHSSSNLLKRFS